MDFRDLTHKSPDFPEGAGNLMKLNICSFSLAGLRQSQDFMYTQNSHGICTKIPNEVTVISFKFRLFWLSPGWVYSRWKNQGRKSKAISVSHSQIKVRIREYVRIKYKNPNQTHNFWYKIVTNTVVVQDILSCRAQAPQLFSASRQQYKKLF